MRFAAGIHYGGANYHGWQHQEEFTSTIQDQLEMAIAKVANHDVSIICAGRTDRGVHATGQTIHFESSSERKNHEWLLGSNSYLPKDIRVQWVKPVSDEFHARFSAISRRYCYIIANQPVPPGLFHEYLTWVHQPLDLNLMQQAAQYFIGTHDFSSFRSSRCQAHSPVRDVKHLNIHRQDKLIVVDIKANAFLHHMVRNIIGVLTSIGIGKMPPIWAQQVLQAKDRKVGDITAKPNGLYLIQVEYPDIFNMETSVQFPAIVLQ